MADWTRDEVEAIVADYFVMLQAEHQNISAVLVNFRQPFIAGYLPRQNYQKLLEQAVLEWLSTEPRFFERLADGPVLMPRARPAIETSSPW
jgi:trans-aconitate methyltransferase